MYTEVVLYGSLLSRIRASSSSPYSKFAGTAIPVEKSNAASSPSKLSISFSAELGGGSSMNMS